MLNLGSVSPPISGFPLVISNDSSQKWGKKSTGVVDVTVTKTHLINVPQNVRPNGRRPQKEFRGVSPQPKVMEKKIGRQQMDFWRIRGLHHGVFFGVPITYGFSVEGDSLKRKLLIFLDTRSLGSSDFTIGGGLKQALDLWDAQKMGRSITKKIYHSLVLIRASIDIGLDIGSLLDNWMQSLAVPSHFSSFDESDRNHLLASKGTSGHSSLKESKVYDKPRKRPSKARESISGDIPIQPIQKAGDFSLRMYQEALIISYFHVLSCTSLLLIPNTQSIWCIYLPLT